MNKLMDFKLLLLYTMTSGLGDFIILGDLMRKVEALIPGGRCLIVHRNNPHVKLWNYDNPTERFFNVYKPLEIINLISALKNAKRKGFKNFGLQMAPGSIQGFFFHTFLKKIKTLDYIVDFNLINADIITPPKGKYILALHLTQIKDLFKVDIPEDFYKLALPLEDINPLKAHNKYIKIGIHPWNRRGHLPCFVWSFEKWLRVIQYLLADKENEVIIFGKDRDFEAFRKFLFNKLPLQNERLIFSPCDSVKNLVDIIASLDLLLSVNTSVVHIGYALDKKIIILSGPSLDLWIPKGKNINIVYDESSIFPGSDKWLFDTNFPSVQRINPEKVIEGLLHFGIKGAIQR